MPFTSILLVLLVTYLIGTLPTAWLALRQRGQDIRKEGSGNVGAMNSFMVTKSKQTFFIVFIIDFLKGVVAVFAARYVAGETSILIDSLAILGVVLGHNFNLWLSISSRRLEGGKGLAAGLGALAMSLVKLIPVWMVFFGIGFYVYKLIWGSGKIAPGTTLATLVLPIGAYLFYGPTAAVVMGITTLAIVVKHVTEMRELLMAGRPGTQT